MIFQTQSTKERFAAELPTLPLTYTNVYAMKLAEDKTVQLMLFKYCRRFNESTHGWDLERRRCRNYSFLCWHLVSYKSHLIGIAICTYHKSSNKPLGANFFNQLRFGNYNFFYMKSLINYEELWRETERQKSSYL